jgi:hypothetical protein
MTDDVRTALRDALRAAGINPYDRADIPAALTPVVRGLIADAFDAAADEWDDEPGTFATWLRMNAAATRSSDTP